MFLPFNGYPSPTKLPDCRVQILLDFHSTIGKNEPFFWIFYSESSTHTLVEPFPVHERPAQLNGYTFSFCSSQIVHRIFANVVTMVTKVEVPLITPGVATPMEEAALRSELAAKYRTTHEETVDEDAEDEVVAPNPELTTSEAPVPEVAAPATGGTLLEAAFVDPAYAWPQGKNAIELQASLQLLSDDDSVFTTDSARSRMRPPTAPRPRFAWCCRSNSAVSPEELRRYEEEKARASEARREHLAHKAAAVARKDQAARAANKYATVPEGILIYRLDTQKGYLQLVSSPHALTNTEKLVQECLVVAAVPYPSPSRRTLQITDEQGKTHLLTACEQRTATAWLEAMNLMVAKKNSLSVSFFRKVRYTRTCFSSTKHNSRVILPIPVPRPGHTVGHQDEQSLDARELTRRGTLHH
jgi:hypothetical protein